MICTVHEFRLDKLSLVFTCRKCGMQVGPKKLPDRDPEKPIKPLRGQMKLPLKKGK